MRKHKPGSNILEKTYLPFSSQQLEKCFGTNESEHVKYFTDSIEKYEQHLKYPASTNSKNVKTRRQIEKDERFWVAQAWMTIFEQDHARVVANLKEILSRAFGSKPPIDFPSWDAALAGTKGDLVLRFEENLSSPKAYREYMSQNLPERQFIPYILEAGKSKKGPSTFRGGLEGATHVDALIVNKHTGFNIVIEAKVLSDIDCQVTYDVFRNQIARNIDVMLENHTGSDLKEAMDPDKSIFLLLTPQRFKDNPQSRLYGYKMNSYQNDPASLGLDLAHREDKDHAFWKAISKRLGWITWTDLNDVNADCCPWDK